MAILIILALLLTLCVIIHLLEDSQEEDRKQEVDEKQEEMGGVDKATDKATENFNRLVKTTDEVCWTYYKLLRCQGCCRYSAPPITSDDVPLCHKCHSTMLEMLYKQKHTCICCGKPSESEYVCDECIEKERIKNVRKIGTEMGILHMELK